MIFHCGECGAETTPGLGSCRMCGSASIMMATFTEKGTCVSVPVDSQDFRLTGKNHDVVKKNPFLRTTIKREWSKTRQQWEYVERVIDRASRTYRETYRDLATGEVTFEKQGPLEDQSLHGPRGKRKKNQ
jgi:hypothetical protein